MQIDIIGAGIGGLTTAIALEQKGFRTRVFEQAQVIKPVGAGIILANNAMQVFEKLGLREEIEAKGNYISSMNLTKPNLKPLSKVDLKYFEKKYGVRNIAIHRGTLQRLLLNKLQLTEIHLDHRLKTIDRNSPVYSLRFENGQSVLSTTLIAADGLNSIVRNTLFPSNDIRDAKQICWRGVTEFNLPNQYRHELNEAWGKDDRFGFVQIDKNKVYWYALKSFHNQHNEYLLSELPQYFREYDRLVTEIISATPEQDINTSQISDLIPIDSWHKENLCLLGDAAHAMTPNLGQGACQAIEDAYVLSECLGKYDVNSALSKYQELRLPKAQRVVKTSWNVGKWRT
jgi:2-polyprenyl-6-methoxyphenol hydroxylase-like FAD-dependent oxidoreductase